MKHALVTILAAVGFAAGALADMISLPTLTRNITLTRDTTLRGTLPENVGWKISIADGATVRLRDANITSLANNEYVANYAGITLLGDATIILEGTNTVRGGEDSYPGIYVPVGKTLTIDGNGSLYASSQGSACGIGGGSNISCGNITIDGGNITATGGYCDAGIGSGKSGSCGNITINGGTVTAKGGNHGAGIGSGSVGGCGNITISDAVTKVTATKGKNAPYSIGAGEDGTCDTVTIGGKVGAVSKSPYTYQPE